MLRSFFVGLVAVVTTSVPAAELVINFDNFAIGSAPTGFVSNVTGLGRPGDWQVIDDQVTTTALAPVLTGAKVPTRHVLAQLDQDPRDEHFPLLIFNGETFTDFTVTTRFKCVRGTIEKMAGLAFRIQDEKNYYVVRASAGGNTFRFYKFVNGERSTPIGPEIEVPPGTWHELSVTCQGDQIRCSLNGRELIPALTDTSFASGRVGFWTKSDAVSYFSDFRINYTPRIPFAQELVTSVMAKFPRLIALKIYAYRGEKPELVTIASTDPSDRGTPGDPVGESVIKDGKIFYGKGSENCSVVVPLPDRNGETVAALRITMKSFPGQTEANAVARTIPIKKEMANRILSVRDLTQ